MEAVRSVLATRNMHTDCFNNHREERTPNCGSLLFRKYIFNLDTESCLNTEKHINYLSLCIGFGSISSMSMVKIDHERPEAHMLHSTASFFLQF